MHWEVVVVGAGAAGLLAAARAAECGRRTLLLEKNRKAGVKILMSGGTRCNLTHDTNERGIVAAFGRQGKFLHSALAALGPRELVRLVESEGVPTKIEETGKIFPASDRARDVLTAFLRRLQRSGAQLSLDDGLRNVEYTDDCFRLFTARQSITADRVIICSGGQSYPGCGTTGDGYQWARASNHTIVPPRPALTPITTSAPWVRQLSGITIPDVGLKLVEREEAGTADASVPGRGKPARPLDERRGSFLFTHFGLSGPAPLDISRTITAHPRPQSLELVCDFLPTTTAEQLTASLRAERSQGGKRQLANMLAMWLPARLVEMLLAEVRIPPDLRAAELNNRDLQLLVAQMKAAIIPVQGTKGFEKAEVTAGGVSLAEIDSSTLESKQVRHLYFAGEVLDLDGPIGGYNFQAAFSTGWLAGQSAAR